MIRKTFRYISFLDNTLRRLTYAAVLHKSRSAPCAKKLQSWKHIRHMHCHRFLQVNWWKIYPWQMPGRSRRYSGKLPIDPDLPVAQKPFVQCCTKEEAPPAPKTCKVGSTSGTCISTSSCKSTQGISTPGKCPDDPDDIQVSMLESPFLAELIWYLVLHESATTSRAQVLQSRYDKWHLYCYCCLQIVRQHIDTR